MDDIYRAVAYGLTLGVLLLLAVSMEQDKVVGQQAGVVAQLSRSCPK